MMNIFKHKKILCAMLAVIMLVPCFTLTASAKTLRTVGTYTAIWEDEGTLGDGDDDMAFRAYIAYISYGKVLSQGINYPYTDCLARCDSYNGSNPDVPFDWDIDSRINYVWATTQFADQQGAVTVCGGDSFLNKTAPGYGPVTLYYKGLTGTERSLDDWNSSYADMTVDGPWYLDIVIRESVSGNFKIYDRND